MNTGISVDSGQGAWLRRLEAIAIFAVSFGLAAVVVYNRTAVQDYLGGIGWLRYPVGIVLMTIVASAPFSVTDALAIMNGVVFGPVMGSVVNALGLIVAAVIAYRIALRTNKLLDIQEQLDRLPAWIKRFPVASPPFLILVRLLPGIGGTLATQTAAAYRVSMWTQIWTKCVVAVPICTLLAFFGDGVAVYIHDHVTQPVKTYVVEHSKKIHLPRIRHSVRPSPYPTEPPR